MALVEIKMQGASGDGAVRHVDGSGGIAMPTGWTMR